MKVAELRKNTVVHVNHDSKLRSRYRILDVSDGDDLRPIKVKRIGNLEALQVERSVGFCGTYTGTMLLCDVHVHRRRGTEPEELC